MVDFDLTGKVAVVTGGTGILCSEMARELALHGATTVVLGTTLAKAQDIAEEINKNGGKAIGLAVDVLNKDSIKSVRDKVIELYGKVDILVNGAGGNRKNATTSDELSFFDIPEDALRYVFDLNFMGTLMTSQVFGEAFARQKSGCIVNVSSMASITPLTNVLGYGAAKAAVNNFTQWLAVHFCQNYSTNIRVNAIAPGFLLTDQNRFLLVDKETGEMTERSKSIIKGTPMGRYGEPEELLGALLFLCSDSASFVTGAVIPIDGGFSVFSGV